MKKNLLELCSIQDSYNQIKNPKEVNEDVLTSVMLVVQIINLLVIIHSVYKLISNFYSVYKTNKTLTKHKHYSELASKVIGKEVTVNIFSAKLPCSMFANKSICISDSMNSCLNDKEMMVFILHEYGEMVHKSTRNATLVVDAFNVFGALLFNMLAQTVSPILLVLMQYVFNKIGMKIGKNINANKIKLNDTYIKKYGYEQYAMPAMEAIRTYLKDELNLSNGKIRSALAKAFKTNAYLQRVKDLVDDSNIVALLKSQDLNIARLKDLVSKAIAN